MPHSGQRGVCNPRRSYPHAAQCGDCRLPDPPPPTVSQDKACVMVPNARALPMIQPRDRRMIGPTAWLAKNRLSRRTNRKPSPRYAPATTRSRKLAQSNTATNAQPSTGMQYRQSDQLSRRGYTVPPQSDQSTMVIALTLATARNVIASRLTVRIARPHQTGRPKRRAPKEIEGANSTSSRHDDTHQQYANASPISPAVSYCLNPGYQAPIDSASLANDDVQVHFW
jgi:hypothetical protein